MPEHPLARLLREDKRYKVEAYIFVDEALKYGQAVMGLGTRMPPELLEAQEEAGGAGAGVTRSPEEERHVTGQQLCEAIRRYALEQYGHMARCVFQSWGVHATGDFGEIVFNLIRIGHMRKTRHDRREDFDNVFDFERDLQGDFRNCGLS